MNRNTTYARRVIEVIVAFVALTISGSTQAGVTFSMELAADGDSRWFDFFGAAFFELDSVWEVRDGTTGEVIAVQSPERDGAFAIEAEGVADLEAFDPFVFMPTVYEELGTSDEGFGEVFLTEGDFSDSYSVAYDDADVAGTGFEVAPITALTLDFVQDIADNDTIFGIGYSTAVSSVAGTVTLVDGAVASIDASANVTLTYDTSTSSLGNIGTLQYDGQFAVTGDAWSLAVDDADGLLLGAPYRLAWDVHGEIANLATLPNLPDADFNDDGLVDGVDFLVWQRNFGAANAAHAQGDSDGNGQIDAADLVSWQTQFGASLPAAAILTVPEPPAGILVALAFVGTAGYSLRKYLAGISVNCP